MAEACFKSADLKQAQSADELSTAQPLPGIASFLHSLVMADIPAAVISNDSSTGIRDFLESHCLSRLFSDIWSSDERIVKPDPAAVKGLCARMKLQPEHCALIGDAETDLKMAKEAGVGD